MRWIGTTAVVLAVALIPLGCGQTSDGGAGAAASAADKPASAQAPTELSIEGPDASGPVRLAVVLPEGWTVNPDFGALVYQPADRNDFVDAPLLQFETAVEGEVAPEAIAGNVTAYLQGAKDGWKKIATGDAALDAQGASVEVVEESGAAGDRFVLLKVTYPEGVSAAMYPPRYHMYRILYGPGEAFFVRVSGTVSLREAERFLAPITAACKSAKRL